LDGSATLDWNGDGERLTIAALTAKAPNGGTLKGGGSIGVDPEAGFPTEISVAFDDALIIDRDIVVATSVSVWSGSIEPGSLDLPAHTSVGDPI
jgi:autotransporter translocation and assembly factor TamB